MVVVKAELWPWGNQSSKKEIGRVVISNDGTGDVTTGNYRVEVETNGVKKAVRVENHTRSHGVWKLLAQAINSLETGKELPEVIYKTTKDIGGNQVELVKANGKVLLEQWEDFEPVSILDVLEVLEQAKIIKLTQQTGGHQDDDGEECSCDELEVINKNGNLHCPKCNSSWDFALVCGDHGFQCSCGARFTCP